MCFWDPGIRLGLAVPSPREPPGRPQTPMCANVFFKDISIRRTYSRKNVGAICILTTLASLFFEAGWICISGWLWTYRSVYLYILRAGIKGVCHHTGSWLILLIMNKILSICLHQTNHLVSRLWGYRGCGVTGNMPVVLILCHRSEGTGLDQ